jgi:hypothetical protein
MAIILSNQRSGVLAKNVSRVLHLIVDSGERGMVFFACEQAPLMTFQSYGLPAHCPVCRGQNPLGGEANANR